MCGRCRCTLDRQQSVSFAERAVKEGVIRVDESFASFEPSYNICPGKHVPILVSSEEGVTLRSAVWGLVPRFQKSRKHDHYKMFNARSEELSAKPSFAGLGRNRCVVLTQGFFEWDTKRVLGRMEKQPYIIYFDGEGGSPAMMAMAGELSPLAFIPSLSMLPSFFSHGCPRSQRTSRFVRYMEGSRDRGKARDVYDIDHIEQFGAKVAA